MLFKLDGCILSWSVSAPHILRAVKRSESRLRKKMCFWRLAMDGKIMGRSYSNCSLRVSPLTEVSFIIYCFYTAVKKTQTQMCIFTRLEKGLEEMFKKVKKENMAKGAKMKARELFFPKGNFFQSVSILYVLWGQKMSCGKRKKGIPLKI